MKKRSEKSYIKYLNEIFREEYKENDKLPSNLSWSLRQRGEISSNALLESEAKEVANALSKAFPGANSEQIKFIKSKFSPDKFQILITTAFIKESVAKKFPDLPPEIIHHILSFLEDKEIVRASTVSQLWHNISKDLLKKLTDTEIKQALDYMNANMNDTCKTLQKISNEIKDLRPSDYLIIAINRIKGDKKNVNVVIENIYMPLDKSEYDTHEIKVPIGTIQVFSELYTEMTKSQLKK